MQKRIITGVALLAIILVLLRYNNYELNFIILGVVLYFAFSESLKLYSIDNNRLVWAALAFYTLTFLTNPIFISVFSIMFVAAVLAHIKAPDLRAVFPFFYPATPIFMIWMLYSEYGVSYLAWLILAVTACDSGAYFVGKAIGKRAFSASSPNKTLEGVIGGIILGTIVGSVCGAYIRPNLTQAICASFLVCVFGIWGDLFESYLKRAAGVKDSGSIFPGHGGMLDRIDGYLFGVVALLWVLSW